METNTIGIVRLVPDAVSWVRVIGSVALPFLMWSSWELTIRLPFGTFTGVPLVWIVVYLALVVTDGMDGALARGLHVSSGLGAKLDALGDALLLVAGATCVFARFAWDDLSTFRFWFYVGIMVQILSDKFIVYIVSKRRFGVGNMLHSIPHKTFAIGAYLMIAYWAFTRTIEPWSILTLWAIMTYAFIDELIYIARAAQYDVDFKGHGFEWYAPRTPTVTGAR